jgi:hypothetical protein
VTAGAISEIEGVLGPALTGAGDGPAAAATLPPNVAATVAANAKDIAVSQPTERDRNCFLLIESIGEFLLLTCHYHDSLSYTQLVLFLQQNDRLLI